MKNFRFLSFVSIAIILVSFQNIAFGDEVIENSQESVNIFQSLITQLLESITRSFEQPINILETINTELLQPINQFSDQQVPMFLFSGNRSELL